MDGSRLGSCDGVLVWHHCSRNLFGGYGFPTRAAGYLHLTPSVAAEPPLRTEIAPPPPVQTPDPPLAVQETNDSVPEFVNSTERDPTAKPAVDDDNSGSRSQPKPEVPKFVPRSPPPIAASFDADGIPSWIVDPAEVAKNNGRMRAQINDLYGALANFSQAILLKPRDAEAYALRGEIYRKLGRVMEASHDRTKAMELKSAGQPLSPKPCWIRYNRFKLAGLAVDHRLQPPPRRWLTHLRWPAAGWPGQKVKDSMDESSDAPGRLTPAIVRAFKIQPRIDALRSVYGARWNKTSPKQLKLTVAKRSRNSLLIGATVPGRRIGFAHSAA